MTKEEKAKAYDKALRVIKKCSPDENGFITIYPQEIFPELKESEDERIRKALLEYFNEQCDMSDWNGVYGYEVVSWLERQGEQKQKWGKEDERMYRGLHNLIYSTPYCDSRKELSDFLDSLKNRLQSNLQQEWSEEDETELTNTIIMLKEGASLHFNKKDITKAVDWLESLRTK